MKLKPTCLLLLLGSLLASAAAAPVPSAPAPANLDRCLFVVEKTDASAPIDNEIRQTVFDLVHKRAGGNIPVGSVFEIWTFGEETRFRGFLPEMWQGTNHVQLAMKASNYLNSIPSRGTNDVSDLATHLRGVAEIGFELTLFLITSPDTRLHGTLYDNELNAIFDVHAARLAEQGRPFITAFRVQDGRLAAFLVSDSAATIAVPPMPASKFSPAEREEMIAAARKAKEAREKPPEPVVAVAAPPPKPVRDIPDDEREGAIILRGAPKPARPVEVARVDPPVQNPEPPKPSKNPEPAPEPTPETVTKVVESVKSPATVDPPPAANTPISEASEEPGPTPSEAPSPATSAAAQVSTLSGTNDTPSELPPPVAVGVPPRTWFTAGGLVVIGLLFFGMAALLVFVLYRRAKSVARPSYISQSMNRRR